MEGGFRMKLYFLRHGPALSRSEWNDPDSTRPLSADGKDAVRRVASAVESLVLDLDIVVTSPYERALATARIVAEAFSRPVPVAENRDLEPHRFTAAALEALLESQTGVASIMLVGHEPSMSEVLSEVIGGGDLVMKKGALARVDLHSIARPRGELRWLLTPKLLDGLNLV